MNELDENPELTTFFALLENAFPETSVQVGFHESKEAYLNELRGLLFTGQDWRTVDFPENVPQADNAKQHKPHTR